MLPKYTRQASYFNAGPNGNKRSPTTIPLNTRGNVAGWVLKLNLGPMRVTRSASKVLSPTHSAAAVGGIPRLRNEPLSGRKRQGLAKPAASNSQKCSAAKTYPCLWPQCVGKSYTKMWSLSRHQVAVHGRGEESDGPFLCEACGGGYGRRDVLNRHRREHCPFREATPE
ncbi:hypothetical protein B0H15DRAFT_796617 [Mycena belliarum]|uniref:C2H2-type domain-containing protein n=1 Tax=Mycena belliarum TaxID=1033014 RepID=A0AAD6XWI2_9AGAR|nr:hypothetical protein B0H15DRAFT_796617 [Mycena belliae]